MFLGNLSTANEHKARKKRGKKKSGKNTSSSIDSDELTDEIAPNLRRLDAGMKPVIYDSKTELLPRELLLDYLKTCVEMMLDKDNIREIILDSRSKQIGLHVAAIQFQREVLENNFQIEQNYGCQYLSSIPHKHPGDGELLDAAKNFMYHAMVSYVQCFKTRAEMDGNVRRTPGLAMNRMDIIELFEVCNAKMCLQETKDELKEEYKKTGSAPTKRVMEIQKEMISLLGYDPDFGVTCVNKISKDFPNDRDLYLKSQFFACAAHVAIQEATFTEKEKTEFYSTVPPMMHIFPHMHLMQQRMAQQRMMQQRMQAAAMMQQQGGAQADSSSSGINGSDAVKAAAEVLDSGDQRMKELEQLKASGILNLLSVPEGRIKIAQLASRIQASKSRVDEEVETWSSEKRVEFFSSFTDGHPVFAVLDDAGKDPMAKMASFITMDDSNLDQVMRMQYIVANDDGGLVEAMRTRMQQQAEKAGKGSVGEKDRSSTLEGILTTIKSLANFKSPQQKAVDGAQHGHDHSHQHQQHQHHSQGKGQGHSHSHDHGHQHHEGCSHHAAPPPPPPDVAKADAERIER